MIYSTVLTLRAREKEPLQANLGAPAYAAVLALIGEADHALASALHDSDAAKPLTVSPLWRWRPRADSQNDNEDGPLHPALSAPSPGAIGGSRDSQNDNENGPLHRMRITALNDEVFSALAQGVLSHDRARPVRVGDATFDLLGLATTPEESRLAACTSFEALLREAEPRTTLALRFLTPTTFRSGGHRNVVFPEPGLLLRSYLARWNALSAQRLPETLGDVASHSLFITRYTLRTATVGFGSYSETGFVGSCELRAQERTSAEALHVFQALADFAFFAGTGAKTTMGMGQTRRTDNARALPDRARERP